MSLFPINTARPNAEPRDLKILKARLWHFTSIGLGNCRAAQCVKHEIENRQQADALTHPATARTQPLTLDPRPLTLLSVEQLTAGLSHLVAVGMANSRAAQKIGRELGRRLLIQSASLTNANFNPDEPRDKYGQWTKESNATPSTTNKLKITGLATAAPVTGHGAMHEPNQLITNLSDSVGDKINGAPFKFGIGFEKGLQEITSDIGQGWAQFADPGPLNQDSYATYRRAQEESLKIVPDPHFNPDTGQWTVADPFATTLQQMTQDRENERERARIPGESLSQASGELAAQLGAVEDAIPGPKIVGTVGEQAGQIAAYAAPSALKYVGPVIGAPIAGLASAGETFNRAFEIYKLVGYPDALARDMARKVAVNDGTLTAVIFALPVGRLAGLPKTVLARILVAAGITGAQLSADELQKLLHAKATYNPNLTFEDIAKEAGLKFLCGAAFGAATHGAAEASKAGSATAPIPAAEPQEPLNHLQETGPTGQWSDPNDAEGKVQMENLRQWAQETGRVKNFEPPPGAEQIKGNERNGYIDPKTQRVYKQTYPPGTFGFENFGQKLERIATPYFYLRRIALMNQAFGSDIRVEGITPGDKPSIITSEPYHEADNPKSPYPTSDEVAQYMRSKGFKALPNTDNGWGRENDGILAYDVRPENFIKTKEGIAPVDLILQGGSPNFPKK